MNAKVRKIASLAALSAVARFHRRNGQRHVADGVRRRRNVAVLRRHTAPMTRAVVGRHNGSDLCDSLASKR